MELLSLNCRRTSLKGVLEWPLAILSVEDTVHIKKPFDHPMGTNNQVMKLNRKLFNGQVTKGETKEKERKEFTKRRCLRVFKDVQWSKK